MAAGSHVVFVSYSGDDSYYGVGKSYSIDVPAPYNPGPDPVPGPVPSYSKEAVKLSVKVGKKSYKRSAKSKVIKISLVSSSGKKIDGKVKVKFIGKLAKKLKGSLAKKLRNGKFEVKVKKGGVSVKFKSGKLKFTKKGSYKFKVSFDGDKKYKGKSVEGSLKIK